VFHVPDPAAAARSLVLATNALLPYSLSVRELGSRRVVESEAARIADLLLDGLASRSAAGSARADGASHTSAARSRRHKTKSDSHNSIREPKP
jgi:hypothetical protein